EIPSGLHLLQNVFRLLAGFFNSLCIDFPIRTRQRRLDQNMPYVHLLGNAVILTTLVVIGLQFVVCNGGLGLDLGIVDQHVADLTLLRYGVVISSLIAVVKALQFGLSWVNLLQQIVLAKYRVIELYFGVLLLKFATYFSICDQHAAGDQGAQLIKE